MAASSRTVPAPRPWRLSPPLYRFMLVVHVISSVAWMGAEAILLTLAIIGITTGNPETLRAVYVTMGLFGPPFYVPLAVVALVSGIVLSIGTRWGLVTYYWIVIKLIFNVALATGGTFFVMTKVSDAADRVSGIPASSLTASMIGSQRFSLVGAFSIGMALLTIATVLSYYKPWGRMPFRQRKS